MKCNILHESAGRLRVHLHCGYMTLHQADVLEYYLRGIDGVNEVKVYDRTQDTVVLYAGERNDVIAALAAFSFPKAETMELVPEHTSRALNREFEDKLVMTVMRRCISKLFLPAPITAALAVLRSVKYIKEGLKALWHGQLSVAVLIGSAHFVFEDEGCRVPEGERDKFNSLPDEYSHLYLCIAGELAAVICVFDPLRKEARTAVQALHDCGIANVVMMTGDNRRTAEAVARQVGVDAVFAEVLPEDKAAFIRQEKAKGHTVIMVGDGVNDSPALSEADAGIAISTGAAIAREIADITIASEDLFELVTLRKLGEALMARIHRDYRFIVGFNFSLIVLGVAGVLPPTTSALLHNMSTLGISLRSMTNLLPDEKNNRT